MLAEREENNSTEVPTYTNAPDMIDIITDKPQVIALLLLKQGIIVLGHWRVLHRELDEVR